MTYISKLPAEKRDHFIDVLESQLATCQLEVLCDVLSNDVAWRTNLVPALKGSGLWKNKNLRAYFNSARGLMATDEMVNQLT